MRTYRGVAAYVWKISCVHTEILLHTYGDFVAYVRKYA